MLNFYCSSDLRLDPLVSTFTGLDAGNKKQKTHQNFDGLFSVAPPEQMSNFFSQDLERLMSIHSKGNKHLEQNTNMKHLEL